MVERYRTNTGMLLGGVRAKLPWADGKLVKAVLDAQLAALLGEKTAEDLKKPEKKKKVKQPKEKKEKKAGGGGDGAAAAKKEEISGKPLKLHAVGRTTRPTCTKSPTAQPSTSRSTSNVSTAK